MKKENEIIEEILKKGNLIDEESYQQTKKEMCIIDDYFTNEEWRTLANKTFKKLTIF